MRTLLLLLILNIFHLGCKPEIQPAPTSGPTIVTGKVIDETTNKIIPYARLQLISEKKGTSAMSQAVVKSFSADENGNFSLQFDAEEQYFYLLTAKAEHFFEDINGVSLKSGINNNNVLVKLQPKGYIKFIIVNEEPRDTIDYFISGYFEPGIELNNFSRDTVIFREVMANKEIPVAIRNRTNNGDLYKGDKIIIAALDTFDYIIKY